MGPFCLFLFLFVLPWDTDLRKHRCNLCQRMFCLCSLLGVLCCFSLFLNFLLNFELQVQLPGTEKWVYDSVVMQEMGIPEKLSRSYKYSEDKGLFIYLLGNAGWISLIKSCLCYYFLGTVRSNQAIITSQTSLYFTEKWQACFSLISQMKSRKYCVLKVHKLIHFILLSQQVAVFIFWQRNSLLTSANEESKE